MCITCFSKLTGPPHKVNVRLRSDPAFATLPDKKLLPFLSGMRPKIKASQHPGFEGAFHATCDFRSTPLSRHSSILPIAAPGNSGQAGPAALDAYAPAAGAGLGIQRAPKSIHLQRGSTAKSHRTAPDGASVRRPRANRPADNRPPAPIQSRRTAAGHADRAEPLSRPSDVAHRRTQREGQAYSNHLA